LNSNIAKKKLIRMELASTGNERNLILKDLGLSDLISSQTHFAIKNHKCAKLWLSKSKTAQITFFLLLRLISFSTTQEEMLSWLLFHSFSSLCRKSRLNLLKKRCPLFWVVILTSLLDQPCTILLQKDSLTVRWRREISCQVSTFHLNEISYSI